MSVLVPPFVEALQFQGEQFLLPYGSSLLAMMYNRDHFSRAGVTDPPVQWNTPDWTYDQFVDNAKKLTLRDGEGNTTQWGISGLFWDSWITLPYPWGGAWVTDDLATWRGPIRSRSCAAGVPGLDSPRACHDQCVRHVGLTNGSDPWAE